MHQAVDREVKKVNDWALRRQRGILPGKPVFIIACIDERIPVEQALGINWDDAIIECNPGALADDSVIRSIAIAFSVLDLKEIIVIGHTECGMMSAKGKTVANLLKEKLKKRGSDIKDVHLDPRVPELKLENPEQNFEKWIGMFKSVDEQVEETVQLLKNHPLVPEETVINGYVWDVNAMKMRKLGFIRSDHIDTNIETGASENFFTYNRFFKCSLFCLDNLKLQSHWENTNFAIAESNDNFCILKPHNNDVPSSH